jgi:hypothetical protein
MTGADLRMMADAPQALASAEGTTEAFQDSVRRLLASR